MKFTYPANALRFPRFPIILSCGKSVNPLRPKSDQHHISLCNINAL